jgi:thiamine-phosphate pyrophosphorylase
MDSIERTRLILVTPPEMDAETFPRRLEEALGGGDVAAVIIAPDAGGRAAAPLASALVPIIQRAGAAALIAEDTQLAGRAGADGVHIGTSLEDLRLAAESHRPKRIVGAGGLTTRHDAMAAGEMGIDYLFFGRLAGDTHDAAHPKALDLAEWWAELMEVPAVIMAGRTLDSTAEAAATGAAFVAVNSAVWNHAGGPAEAVGIANAALQRRGRAA